MSSRYCTIEADAQRINATGFVAASDQKWHAGLHPPTVTAPCMTVPTSLALYIRVVLRTSCRYSRRILGLMGRDRMLYALLLHPTRLAEHPLYRLVCAAYACAEYLHCIYLYRASNELSIQQTAMLWQPHETPVCMLIPTSGPLTTLSLSLI